MDWNFLVALGTIGLAVAAFVSMNQGRKQTQAILRQLNLTIGQQTPYLFIKSVSFEHDSVSLEIENATNVPAFWVGLVTRFFFVCERYYDSPSGDHEVGWGEAVKLRDQDKIVYSKYYSPAPDRWPKLIHDDKAVVPDASVSFFDPQGVSVHFPPKSIVQVKSLLRFVVSWPGKDGPSSQAFEYGAFRDFLLKNNVDQVAISVSLICKNAEELPLGQGYVTSFILRTSSDKSLSDSSKNAQRFDFLPLSHAEYLSAKFWITYEQYCSTYSRWHIIG